MKALNVTGSTLVGFRKVIGVKGNCFDVMTETGQEVKVLNIGLESLGATGVPFPIEGRILLGKAFAVTDERIPKEAFRSGPCTVCLSSEYWDEMVRTE